MNSYDFNGYNEVSEVLSQYIDNDDIVRALSELIEPVKIYDIAIQSIVKMRMKTLIKGLHDAGLNENCFAEISKYCKSPKHKECLLGLIKRLVNAQSTTCAILLTIIVSNSVKSNTVLNVIEWKVCDALEHLCDADLMCFRKTMDIATMNNADQIKENDISKCAHSLELMVEEVQRSLQSCMLNGLFTKNYLGSFSIGGEGQLEQEQKEYDQSYMLNPLSNYLYKIIKQIPLKHRTV